MGSKAWDMTWDNPAAARRKEMKMESGHKFWIAVWRLVAAVVITAIVGGYLYCHFTQVRMAELGFQKTTVPGNSIPHYQKVK